MSAGAVAAGLRRRLHEVLAEPDGDRPLDSLETAAVLSLLSGLGIEVPPSDRGHAPTTIEGWARWAEQRSTTS